MPLQKAGEGQMNIRISKASGAVEDFQISKLRQSLLRSGADAAQTDEIIARILPDLSAVTSTRKLYRLAHKYLHQFNRTSVLRYYLKKGMMRLGPTGYPFEKYIAALLRTYGYETEVSVILQGRCVSHEVDVVARKGTETALIECKYRNSAYNAPDVKIAMYVHSRFRALRSALRHEYPGRRFSGWLVTNTRFTSDAVKYADCSGLRLKRWLDPGRDSLASMIEDKKLYPVTVLSGLSSAQLKKLFAKDIILMKELARMDTSSLREILSITDRQARNIRDRADKLCFC